MTPDGWVSTLSAQTRQLSPKGINLTLTTQYAFPLWLIIIKSAHTFLTVMVSFIPCYNFRVFRTTTIKASLIFSTPTKVQVDHFNAVLV